MGNTHPKLYCVDLPLNSIKLLSVNSRRRFGDSSLQKVIVMLPKEIGLVLFSYLFHNMSASMNDIGNWHWN